MFKDLHGKRRWRARNRLPGQHGISFFLADDASLRNTLREIWEGEIEPYLDEYFYGQESKVEPLRWTNLVKNDLQDWA